MTPRHYIANIKIYPSLQQFNSTANQYYFQIFVKSLPTRSQTVSIYFCIFYTTLNTPQWFACGIKQRDCLITKPIFEIFTSLTSSPLCGSNDLKSPSVANIGLIKSNNMLKSLTHTTVNTLHVKLYVGTNLPYN